MGTMPEVTWEEQRWASQQKSGELFYFMCFNKEGREKRKRKYRKLSITTTQRIPTSGRENKRFLISSIRN